ncbi:STN and carboxypeptidase regulatory-like domain-containing protein [uncultured Microscilla sp.]|uniref:STN and carboxypeptidase regulatory-like domain-containing protein n=1 Tax=uncultured Microscilla sp. TaxID=432653 RepID=UPI00260C8E7B|nr:STN and carboxypeptidase regulatory-like domain-containing protein [uncultured Microscilla sp.]
MIKWLAISFLLLFGMPDSFGQSVNLSKIVSCNYKNKTLQVILKKLEKKYRLRFSYSSSLLPLNKKLTLSVRKQPLKKTLHQLFSPLDIQYALIGNQLVLKKQAVNPRSYLSFSTPIVAQKPVTSKVEISIIDAASGTTIPKAHIFKSDSILVGTSGPQGRFSIRLSPTQKVTLTFSHVSYEPVTKVINPSTQKEYAIWLIPKIEELKGITISINRDKRWKKLFNKFKDDFLGTSSNAAQCKILNPWVVEFLETAQGIKLKKESEDTLEIENYALGYKLMFLLSKFVLRNDDVYYKGQCWFSDLSPKNKKQQRRWQRNRRRAYKGSFNHFLAAMAHNRVTKEGFEVMVSKYPPYKSNGFYFSVPHKELLRPGKKQGEHFFVSPYYVKVTYYGELEEYNYIKWYKRSNPWVRGHLKPRAQLSWIWLGTGSVKFNSRGRILNDAERVIRYGYWAWERVGEMLPHQYLAEAYTQLAHKNKR